MSAYNPPLFNNSVIQFNPTIYETGTISTASQSLTLLKTDNIQCLLPNDLVSLYTVGSGQVTIGTGGQGVKVVGLLSSSLADITGIATNNIDVQTGQTSISIGTAATTVLIRPTTTQIGGNLQANNIDKYTSGPISLYQTAVGAITLGNNAANVDIQAIRIATAAIYPSSSQTLYIGNSNAPTIELGATSCSTLNIGSVSSTSYFKNAISAIFGVSPNTYLPAGTGTLTGCGMRLYNSGTQSSLDLYSAGTSIANALPSSRFISTGGSALINTASLQIQSNTINIESVANTNIGSNTTVVNTIRSSNGLIIGQDPTTYSTGTGFMTGNGMRFSADSNVNLIDFHTSSLAGQQDFTARIRVDPGTTQNTGALALSAGSINLSSSGTVQVGNSTNTNTIGNLAVIGSQIYPISSSAMTVGYANTTSVTVGSTSQQNPVTISGIGYFTNANIQSLRTDFASFGGMQVSWNRTGGNGETNLVSYQGPGSNGGITLANVNTAGTYQELISAKSGSVTFTPVASFNNGLSYGRGNLTSKTLTQTGGFGNGSTTVPANSVVNYSATWAAMGLADFTTAPSVICCNGTSSGLGQKLIISCYGATTTQVSFSLYNPSSTTTGSVAISIQFIATGGY